MSLQIRNNLIIPTAHRAVFFYKPCCYDKIVKIHICIKIYTKNLTFGVFYIQSV